MNINYCEALCEVSYILNGLEKEDYNKIPSKFIDFINNNKSKYYQINFSLDMPYESMKLKKETIAILGIIYRKYLVSEEKRKELTDIYHQKLKTEKAELIIERNKKREVKNIFNDISNNKIVEQSVKDIPKEILVVSKEKWYEKILKKLKSLLNKGGVKNV